MCSLPLSFWQLHGPHRGKACYYFHCICRAIDMASIRGGHLKSTISVASVKSTEAKLQSVSWAGRQDAAPVNHAVFSALPRHLLFLFYLSLLFRGFSFLLDVAGVFYLYASLDAQGRRTSLLVHRDHPLGFFFFALGDFDMIKDFYSGDDRFAFHVLDVSFDV